MRDKIIKMINESDLSLIALSVGITCTLVSIGWVLTFFFVIDSRLIRLTTIYDYAIVTLEIAPIVIFASLLSVVFQIILIPKLGALLLTMTFLIITNVAFSIYIYSSDINILPGLFIQVIASICVTLVFGFSGKNSLTPESIFVTLVPVSLSFVAILAYGSAKLSLKDSKAQVSVEKNEFNANYTLMYPLYNGVIVHEKGNSTAIFFPWNQVTRINYR